VFDLATGFAAHEHAAGDDISLLGHDRPPSPDDKKQAGPREEVRPQSAPA
jgi:hypothetical protein